MQKQQVFMLNLAIDESLTHHSLLSVCWSDGTGCGEAIFCCPCHHKTRAWATLSATHGPTL